MNCNACGAVAVPGALLCSGCGVPLPVGAQAAAPTGPSWWAVVEGGEPGARVPLPAEGEVWRVGRHDLAASPPWVVDVDLLRVMRLGPGEAAPVSRDQAHLARRAGELLLTPRGQAPVLHRARGQQDYATLPAGTATTLRAGDRVVFGSGTRALVLEAA